MADGSGALLGLPDDAADTNGAGFTVVEAPAHEAELTRLVALDPIAYDQQRQAAADTLGVRVGTLDAVVQARRPMPEAATGRSVTLPDVEPWPSTVQTGDLFDELTAAVSKHLILSVRLGTHVQRPSLRVSSMTDAA